VIEALIALAALILGISLGYGWRAWSDAQRRWWWRATDGFPEVQWTRSRVRPEGWTFVHHKS